jgi:hypothetical protein
VLRAVGFARPRAVKLDHPFSLGMPSASASSNVIRLIGIAPSVGGYASEDQKLVDAIVTCFRSRYPPCPRNGALRRVHPCTVPWIGWKYAEFAPD